MPNPKRYRPVSEILAAKLREPDPDHPGLTRGQHMVEMARRRGWVDEAQLQALQRRFAPTPAPTPAPETRHDDTDRHTPRDRD